MRPIVFAFALLATLGAIRTEAQSSGASRPPSVGSVSGIVRDSLASGNLAGAVVQLVGTGAQESVSLSTTSDSLGRYRIDSVPDGRFMLGFFHPMLDSLGIDAPLREVRVDARAAVRADLAIPSPQVLRAAICAKRIGPSTNSDSGALILGFVRDARTLEPTLDASVTVEWIEFSFASTGISRRTPRFVRKVEPNGWFALCDVPSSGIIALTGSKGADSTDRLEIDMPKSGFIRRDLYVAPVPPRIAVTPFAESNGTRDTISRVARPIRTGNGRIVGSIATAVSGKPVVEAFVSILDGPRTRSATNGEWTLASAPAGTRMLEVRAVGYYPVRQPVDIVSGAAPVRVVMSTLRAVLDTVRVTASRTFDRRLQRFAERRRSGAGRYLTAEQIAVRQVIQVSELLRTVTGVFLEPGEAGTTIQLRGSIGERCLGDVFLDGRYLGAISAEELDGWVRPDEIAGIEVYAGAGIPPEFDRGMSGQNCGSVVIWTK